MKTPAVILKRGLIARDFLPASGLQRDITGRVWYRRARNAELVTSPALVHWLHSQGASSNYEVCRTSLCGQEQSGLLLLQDRTPLALLLRDEPDPLKGALALGEYRGVNLAICGDVFYVPTRSASALTYDGYCCPVVKSVIPRRAIDGSREFAFEIVDTDAPHVREEWQRRRRPGFDSSLICTNQGIDTSK